MVSRAGIAAEIVEIKDLIASLAARVAVLEERLASEESVAYSPPKFASPNRVGSHYGGKGQRSAEKGYSPGFDTPASSQPKDCLLSGSPAASGSLVPTDLVREEAARETGRFFQRCLLGLARGSSGRGKVSLPNNYYVIVQGIRGEKYLEPVRLCTTFPECKAIVSDGKGGFGCSIFAGFHSIWEAKIAVLEANLAFPEEGDW